VSFSWPQQAFSIRIFLPGCLFSRIPSPQRLDFTLAPRKASGLRSRFRGSIPCSCPALPSAQGSNASTFAAATLSVALASSMLVVLLAGTAVVLIASSAYPNSCASASPSMLSAPSSSLSLTTYITPTHSQAHCGSRAAGHGLIHYLVEITMGKLQSLRAHMRWCS